MPHWVSEIDLETPEGASSNLATVSKPVIDGVVAAFHRHSDPIRSMGIASPPRLGPQTSRYMISSLPMPSRHWGLANSSGHGKMASNGIPPTTALYVPYPKRNALGRSSQTGTDSRHALRTGAHGWCATRQEPGRSPCNRYSGSTTQQGCKNEEGGIEIGVGNDSCGGHPRSNARTRRRGNAQRRIGLDRLSLPRPLAQHWDFDG